MRALILAAAAFSMAASPAMAQSVYVHSYTTKNGTYVAPHYRSAPDSSKLNNWSTKGNVNPYTGQMGTRNPYAPSYSSPSYQPYSSPSYSSPSYSSPSYSSPYSTPSYSGYSYGSSSDSDSDGCC